jgi:L-ribulokinase
MVPGAIGMAKDIFVPGYYGHIFGQSAVGDIFEWFMNNLVPYKYYIEAEEKGISIFDVMNGKVKKYLRENRACWHWIG